VGLRLSRALHAASPVSEGPGGRRDLTPSPLSVLVSLHRLKCGFVCSPHGEGCHRRRHLHRHIHRRVAPPVRRFSRVQASPLAHSDFGHHFCESHTSSRAVIVVARSLVDASGRSRSLARLRMNPLNCVDSCARPPPAVSLVLGRSLQGQFDVQNRLPPSVF